MKVFLKMGFLVLALLFSHNLFAYENIATNNLLNTYDEKTAENSAPRHRVSTEVNIIGVGLRYEYEINPYFSIGLFGYFQTLLPVIFFAEGVAGTFASVYPFAGSFFIDLGMGYNISSVVTSKIPGPSIVPGLGWKIDFGKPEGFFISPGLKFPISLGEKFDIVDDTFTSVIGTSFSIVIFFGLGLAF